MNPFQMPATSIEAEAPSSVVRVPPHAETQPPQPVVQIPVHTLPQDAHPEEKARVEIICDLEATGASTKEIQAVEDLIQEVRDNRRLVTDRIAAGLKPSCQEPTLGQKTSEQTRQRLRQQKKAEAARTKSPDQREEGEITDSDEDEGLGPQDNKYAMANEYEELFGKPQAHPAPPLHRQAGIVEKDASTELEEGKIPSSGTPEIAPSPAESTATTAELTATFQQAAAYAVAPNLRLSVTTTTSEIRGATTEFPSSVVPTTDLQTLAIDPNLPHPHQGPLVPVATIAPTFGQPGLMTYYTNSTSSVPGLSTGYQPVPAGYQPIVHPLNAAGYGMMPPYQMVNPYTMEVYPPTNGQPWYTVQMVHHPFQPSPAPTSQVPVPSPAQPAPTQTVPNATTNMPPRQPIDYLTIPPAPVDPAPQPQLRPGENRPPTSYPWDSNGTHEAQMQEILSRRGLDPAHPDYENQLREMALPPAAPVRHRATCRRVLNADRETQPESDRPAERRTTYHDYDYWVGDGVTTPRRSRSARRRRNRTIRERCLARDRTEGYSWPTDVPEFANTPRLPEFPWPLEIPRSREAREIEAKWKRRDRENQPPRAANTPRGGYWIDTRAPSVCRPPTISLNKHFCTSGSNDRKKFDTQDMRNYAVPFQIGTAKTEYYSSGSHPDAMTRREILDDSAISLRFGIDGRPSCTVVIGPGHLFPIKPGSIAKWANDALSSTRELFHPTQFLSINDRASILDVRYENHRPVWCYPAQTLTGSTLHHILMTKHQVLHRHGTRDPLYPRLDRTIRAEELQFLMERSLPAKADPELAALEDDIRRTGLLLRWAYEACYNQAVADPDYATSLLLTRAHYLYQEGMGDLGGPPLTHLVDGIPDTVLNLYGTAQMLVRRDLQARVPSPALPLDETPASPVESTVGPNDPPDPETTSVPPAKSRSSSPDPNGRLIINEEEELDA